MINKDIFLFDLDGTLTESNKGITKSIQYALNYFGISVLDERQLISFIGMPLKNAFMELYGFDAKKADAAVDKYRERYADVGIFECTLYFGIADILDKLKTKGKTLMVATSKPTVYAERILKHFQIDSLFSFVGGSELSGERNAKDEVIAHVCNQNGIIEKNNVIMIGDRKHDIIGAKLNGIDSVGVLYGFGSYDELFSHSPLFLADSVGELSRILCGE